MTLHPVEALEIVLCHAQKVLVHIEGVRGYYFQFLLQQL